MLGIAAMIPTIKYYSQISMIYNGEKTIAISDAKQCWSGQHEMSYQRQHDFHAFAMKTDAQVKEFIFQQGMLAGALSATKNIPIPKNYEDFSEFQKSFDRVQQKEKEVRNEEDHKKAISIIKRQ